MRSPSPPERSAPTSPTPSESRAAAPARRCASLAGQAFTSAVGKRHGGAQCRDRRRLPGLLSRRINDEHRLIDKVTEDSILIAQCRYHYEG
nr:type II toxin-antitoxin system YoeB family toxin [Streptacidiphilus neutrinimicus]